MYSVGSGSVILANYKENQIVINNCTFTNNYAILGGVFYSQFTSSITWNYWTFVNNIAIRGGLAFLNSNGIVILNQWTITANQALNAPILYISACQSDFSVISNSSVYQNNIILMTDLLAQNGTGLSHIDSSYLSSVQANQDFYQKSVSGSQKSGISMIKGKVALTNGTIVYNQLDFLAAFESEIDITDSIIRDVSIDTGHVVFHLLSSTFTFTNSTVTNITCPASTEAIFQVRLESTFTTAGTLSIVTNTTCEFTFLLYSYAYINDISLVSNSLTTPLMESVESTASFTGITVKNINTTASMIISVENAASLITNSSNFLSANQIYFYVTGSTVTFQDSLFDNLMNIQMKAVYFETWTVTISGSTFQNLVYNDHGGAVDTLDSNIEIDTSTFSNNSWPIAGAVYLSCEAGTTCTYSIVNNTFINNTATTNGGAILYDYYKPTFSGNTYTNNTALYGPNVAGYAVKVNIESVPTQVYVSGQTIATPIKYKLVDADGLTIATDSDSVITISPVSSTDKVIGNTDVTVVNGVATFSDVTLISSPGAPNINFTISSSNIDLTQISTAFGLGESDTIQTLNVNFRAWVKGEQQTNNMWTVCPTGKYSLIPGSADCNICPKYSTCLGGDVIWVDAGYWRSSFDSDNILSWINSNAWLQYQGTPSDVPYNCQTGYFSNLWDSWTNVNGTQYQRTGDHEWGVCPDPILNAFRIFGLVILLVIIVIVIIWSNIRTTEDSPSSILIRILTNYFQVVTSAASFNLTFPSSLNNFFQGVKTVGQSAQIFLSVDWFIQDFGIVKTDDTTEYFKALMTSLSPFIFWLIIVAVWFIIQIFKRYSLIDFRSKIIISVWIILYLLHPTLTGMAMGLFNCYEVDTGQFWLYKDLKIRCWQGTHPVWAFGLGIPMIIFWIVGLPVIGFFIVRFYREKLDDQVVTLKI